MRKSVLYLTSSLPVLAASSLFIGAAQAQDGEEAAPTDDTIVITATRREETVQTAPINIAAVGVQQIEEQGLDDLAELLAYVPGINIVDRGGRQGNPIIVRGLNAEGLGSGDGNNDGGGTVATYVGDIPLFVDLRLNDLERVEVLLGPQGTLYGAGTLGGAIRYIPKKPDFAGDSLSVRGDVYLYSEADDFSTDVGFTFNKAFGDTFAIRGSLDLLNDSGFIDYAYLVQEIGVSDPDPDFSDPLDVASNLRTQDDANGEETLSGRLAARWTPTDWLDGTLTYYYQKNDIEGRQFSSRRSSVPGVGRYESALRVPEPNEITNQLLALEVTADLGFAELTSASGFSKFEDEGQRDQTDLLITLEYSYEAFPSFTAFTREVGEEERFNQEVRLVSSHGGPFNWIVGGFYNRFEAVGSSEEYTPFYQDFAGFDRPDALEYFSTGYDRTTEQAVFGEVGYNITDRWDVTVGVRAYEYEVKGRGTVSFPLFAFLDSDLVDAGFEPDDLPLSLGQIESLGFDPALDQEDSGTLYKFNTSYQFTDGILAYFTYSEGYRLGARNSVGPCPEFDPDDNTQGSCALTQGQQFGENAFSTRDETQFFPDITKNYEIGAKTTWLDGDLILNGAVYIVEWTDPQLTSATINASIPITVNADGAETSGIELSGQWQITDQLEVRGSYSRTMAELTAQAPGLVAAIDTSEPGFGTVLIDGEDGDRLPGSPEDQFSIFGSYTFPLTMGDVILNAGYAWQGDVLTRTGDRGGGITLDSFGIANASVALDSGDWKLTLYVDNLLDEYAETGSRSTPLTNQVLTDANGGPVYVRSHGTFIAPPRSIGLRFTWDLYGD